MNEYIDERHNNRFISLYRINSANQIDCDFGEIDILAIGISFKLYDIKTNKEILFNQYPFVDEIIGMIKRVKLVNGKKIMVSTPVYLTDCVEIYVTKKNLCKGYIKKRLLKRLGYKLKIKVEGYYKDNDYEDNIGYSKTINDLKQIKITNEDFKKILKDNINNFTAVLDNEYDSKISLNLPVDYNSNFKIEI